MPLGSEVNIGPGDVELDGVAAAPKRGSPQFSLPDYCGQTAPWMKTPLGTEVGFGLGHLLEGNAAPHERATAALPPFFGPCLLWPRSPVSATAYVFFSLSTYLSICHTPPFVATPPVHILGQF